MIKDKSLGQPEPLMAMGVVIGWGHDPAKASGYFLEALKYAPEDPFALQELGRAQLLALNWGAADDILKRALAAGAGPDARLLHAEDLLRVGTAQAAREELDRYLNGRDIKKMPARVRALSDRIEEKKKDAAAFDAANAKLAARGAQPLDYINHPPKDLADFEPAADQSPLEPILAAVGQKVAELYNNLPNTSSTEKIHQERLNHKGQTEKTLEQKFRYLCLLPPQPYGLSVEEYRADSTGTLAAPQGLEDHFMLTSGFVSLPLVFHPTYQEGSTFRYLGRQKVKGLTTQVIAFAQEPAKAQLYGTFKIGRNESRSTYVQGLAWVDPASYRIVRLRTDLLTPLPQIGLNKETTEIDFNEVHFNSVAQSFWLPGKVDVTIDFAGRILRNTHQYSDFLIFNVEQKNKIGMPKATPISSSGSDHPSGK